MNPNQRYLGEDSADSDSDVVMHMPDQIDAGVMNSNYIIEELLTLTDSSFDSEVEGDGDSDSECDAIINDRVRSNVDNVTKRKKFPLFRLVFNPEHLVFENNMLFTSPKQFKATITKYVVNGGWGVKFVKNDKVRVTVKCQPPCKFTAYLTKMSREMSW